MIYKKLIITLNEVKEYLEFKKNETAIQWLNNNEVPVYNLGKRSKMVYRVDFESALLVPLAKNLIKKSPNNWKEDLKLYVGNNVLYNLILSKITENPLLKRAITRIKPKNPKEEKLLKDLLS